jgi:hypothetical protein
MNYKNIKKKKKLELTRDTGYDTKITTYKANHVKIMKSLINHILKYKIRERNINFLIKVNY